MTKGKVGWWGQCMELATMLSTYSSQESQVILTQFYSVFNRQIFKKNI